jgi:hypothetical protein
VAILRRQLRDAGSKEFFMPHELPIPPAACDADASVELIRLWAANEKLHSVLRIGYWEDQGSDECDAWGVVLADMLHHIANAHKEAYGRDRRETIKRVIDAFQRESARPTSPRVGEFTVSRNGDQE